MKELLKISHIQEAGAVLLMVLDKLLERRVRLDQVQEPPTGPGAEESSKGTGNIGCAVLGPQFYPFFCLGLTVPGFGAPTCGAGWKSLT